MRLISGIKNTVKAQDIFSSTQLLRYESGGILSIILYVIIIVSFASNVGDTLNKNVLQFTENIVNQANPHRIDFKVGQDEFMFAIRAADLTQNTIDLNTFKKYFEVNAVQASGQYGQNVNWTLINLVPCTKQHWKNFPQILNKFEGNQMQKWLCPKIGSQIIIQGGTSSPISKSILVNFIPCNNFMNLPTYTCASNSQISQYFELHTSIQAQVLFTNSILNLNQKDFKQISLYQAAVCYFSVELGVNVGLIISDYQINFDSSYMPYSNIQQTTGTKIFTTPHQAVFYRRNNTIDAYARFGFAKSNDYYVYSRNTQKLSTLFSYIGGLFGAFTTALFLFKFFVGQAYQIDQIKNFYNFDQDNQFKFIDNFNIFKYLGIKLYQFIKFVGFKCEWNTANKYIQFRSQICQQLNISFLIKRVINLQRLMSKIAKKQTNNQGYEFTTINQIKLKTGIHSKVKNIQNSQISQQKNQNAQYNIVINQPLPPIKKSKQDINKPNDKSRNKIEIFTMKTDMIQNLTEQNLVKKSKNENIFYVLNDKNNKQEKKQQINEIDESVNYLKKKNVLYTQIQEN